jgi:AcrR family transcriptional regulator
VTSAERSNVASDEGHSKPGKTRMTGLQRREQLIAVGESLFAERGFDATTIEELALRAEVSKPVIYGHFGGKEGLYAVVVDRETHDLLGRITSALSAGHPRVRLEQVAMALLTYVEERTDGFRILVRASPVATSTGTFSGLLNDIASQVEHILAREFHTRGYPPTMAPMYAQALVGMVALTAQWWLDERVPAKKDVAAHLVNLCWNGLAHLESAPRLRVT